MRVPLLLLSALIAACAGSDIEDDEHEDEGEDEDEDEHEDESGSGSAGCGKDAADAAGGTLVTIDAGSAGDGERTFWLSLPDDYDPDEPHSLVVGYAGTNWVGEQIQPYLDLEGGGGHEIFVYPDPLWRSFEGWGTYGGWVLGAYADPADGMGDLVFTEAVLDYMEAGYCVDTERVFATGHSWGGDMAAVTACFLGDRFTASVPVAANSPYWFDDGGVMVSCEGEAAVWTMFGIADDHFTSQDYAGQYGDEQDAFWRAEHDCGDAEEALSYGAGDECVAYTDCGVETRYCLYGPATGHQVPSYFSEATMDWFRSF